MLFISDDNKWFKDCPMCDGKGEMENITPESVIDPICDYCEGDGRVPTDDFNELLEALEAFGFFRDHSKRKRNG